ncbi:MAG: hypothetical protein ACE37H_03070 [Phycisphaeraceae bacterium]
MLTLLQRFRGEVAPTDALVDLSIRAGTRADYLALQQHHYRPGHPMTTMRVFAIDDRTPTAGDRLLSRPIVPRPIAVLVESLPSLSCRLRDAALGGRYRHLRPGQRSAMLNSELRCVSRVIVDPRFRGLGLAVRLVRHALATATTRYTEALAVMGRVSPFFERAGMTAYERPPLPVDERALAALRYAGFEPRALALPAALAGQIEALPNPTRAVLIRELSRWYRAAGGRGIRTEPALSDTLRAAQQRLLARPIYYLHENTHVGT